MKLYVVLDKDGIGRIAEGGEPYSFDFRTRSVEAGREFMPTNGDMLMETIEVALPSKEDCLPQAVQNIEMKIKEVRHEAASEIRELEVKRANLLALPAPAQSPKTITPEFDDDIPF